MTKITKLLLISSIAFKGLSSSISCEYNDIDKETENAYYILSQMNEFKDYKKVRDLFRICWNGDSPDILKNNEFLNPANLTTMQKFINKNHFQEEEILFKEAIIDQILPKLYTLQEDGSYTPTKSLNQIASFFSGCSNIEYNDGSTHQLAATVTTQRFLFIDKYIFLNTPELKKIYQDYKSSKKMHPKSSKNTMKGFMEAIIKDPFTLNILSTHSFIDPKMAKELNKFSARDFNETVNRYRFRYCVLSICFPELFLDVFSKKATHSFKICTTYQDVMDTSLALGQLGKKNEQRSCFENILCLDPKTKKYVKKDIKDLNESDKVFFKEALLKRIRQANFFTKISRDFILYQGFEKDDAWCFSPLKKDYNEKVQNLLATYKNDVTKCRTLLQNYYLTNKNSLINLLSDGKETKDAYLKFTIFDKTNNEEKIKLELKKFLLKNENLFNIFELLANQDTLNQFYEILKRIDVKTLQEVEQKYAYRSLIIRDYFPGKLEQKRQDIISDLQKKSEEHHQKELERDRLFAELLEEDNKKSKKSSKKKPVKKTPLQKAPPIETKKSKPLVPIKIEKKEELKKQNNNNNTNKPAAKKTGNNNSSKKSKNQKKSVQKPSTQKSIEKKVENAENKLISKNIIILQPTPEKEEDRKNSNNKITILKRPIEEKIEDPKKSQINGNIIINEYQEKKESNIIINKIDNQPLQSQEELVSNNNISRNIVSLENQIIRLENHRNEIQQLILSKEAHCKAVEFGTATIQQEIARVRYHLESVQNLKAQERKRFEADLEGLKNFFRENNPEDVVKKDMDSFIFQANQILTNSYADFYNGVGHMNLMIEAKYKLIEEINVLLNEQSFLQTEISSYDELSPKENIIQLEIPEKKDEKKSGIFSRIKERKGELVEKKNEFVATVKGVASVIKNGDLRNLPTADLSKKYTAILTQKNQLNLQNSQLKKQLEYVNEKLADLLEENRQAMKRLESFHASYNRIMNQFKMESASNQNKIQTLYQGTIMSISSSTLKESLTSSIRFFQQVGYDASLQMGTLNRDIQNIMEELNALEVQKNTLFFGNTKLKAKIDDLKQKSINT